MEFITEEQLFGLESNSKDFKEGLRKSIDDGYGIKIRMKVGGINITEKGNATFTSLTKDGTAYITLIRDEGQELIESELASKYIDKEIEILNVVKDNIKNDSKTKVIGVRYNTVFNTKDIKVLGDCDALSEGEFKVLYEFRQPLIVKQIFEDLITVPKLDKDKKPVLDKRGNPETITSRVQALRMVGRSNYKLIDRTIAMLDIKNQAELEKYKNKNVVFKNYEYSEKLDKYYSEELPTIVEETTTKKQEAKQPETK